MQYSHEAHGAACSYLVGFSHRRSPALGRSVALANSPKPQLPSDGEGDPTDAGAKREILILLNPALHFRRLRERCEESLVWVWRPLCRGELCSIGFPFARSLPHDPRGSEHRGPRRRSWRLKMPKACESGKSKVPARCRWCFPGAAPMPPKPSQGKTAKESCARRK